MGCVCVCLCVCPHREERGSGAPERNAKTQAHTQTHRHADTQTRKHRSTQKHTHTDTERAVQWSDRSVFCLYVVAHRHQPKARVTYALNLNAHTRQSVLHNQHVVVVLRQLCTRVCVCAREGERVCVCEGERERECVCVREETDKKKKKRVCKSTGHTHGKLEARAHKQTHTLVAYLEGNTNDG